jgi:hypothetical protein
MAAPPKISADPVRPAANGPPRPADRPPPDRQGSANENRPVWRRLPAWLLRLLRGAR